MNKKVQNLLLIIKYTPSFIVVMLCILIAIFIFQEQIKELKDGKRFVQTEYMNMEKSAIYENINTVHNYIKDEIKQTEESLKKDLKLQINIAHKIATNIYNKNKNTLSKNEIIKAIKEALEDIRFNEGRGYFSIHTMEGINILHPLNPQFENTSVLNRKDSEGNYPVQKVISIAKTKDEGFSTWNYFKPNDKTKEFKKIGIVKRFEPYNLIITTAEYVDEYTKVLKHKTLNYISKLKYMNEGFIFVINSKGDIISHKSNKILNKNIFKDKSFSHVDDFFGKLISSKSKEVDDFTVISPTASLGEGTTEKKVIYAKKLDEWQWIIATGFKLSDANKIIEKREALLEEKYNRYKENILLYGGLFALLLLSISFYLSRVIEEKFVEYQESLQEKLIENKTQKETLLKAQRIAKIGEYELDLQSKTAHWSQSMIRIFGIKKLKEKPNLKLLKELMYEEDWNIFDSSIQKCVHEKTEHLCRYRIKRPSDETTVWIECRGELTKDNKLVGTIQDITTNKTLEIENSKQEKLLYQQSKMASMGDMIGNIAHQWRQPLSAISTASTGAKLQKEMGILEDDDFNDKMDLINNSAQYLSETINDFRDFFNPNNSDVKDILITDALDKTLKLVDPQYKAKDIEIIQNIKNYELEAIENELVQVLINILNNARDILLTKENTRRLIFINTYQKENASYIEIIDNGGGVDNSIIDRIFEPYFTTKHQSQGTGIGLYMSEEIVRNHLNGTLSVENHTYTYDDIQYHGACFTIKLIKD